MQVTGIVVTVVFIMFGKRLYAWYDKVKKWQQSAEETASADDARSVHVRMSESNPGAVTTATMSPSPSSKGRSSMSRGVELSIDKRSDSVTPPLQF